MPHVYMVTSGPGSNGTTTWRAVSWRRIRECMSIGRSVDPGEPRGDSGLVPHVELEQHRRERLDGHGVGELAGVEGATAGDPVGERHHLVDGVPVVTADHHVAL